MEFEESGSSTHPARGSRDFSHRQTYQNLDSSSGYDFYRQQHHLVGVEDSEDRHSIKSLNIEDLKTARRLLSTVRVRRKSRKANWAKQFADDAEPRQNNGPQDDDDDDDGRVEDEYDEVGLPSLRQRTKSLTQKLISARQQQSTTEVAKNFREAVLTSESGRLHFYPSSFVKRLENVTDTVSGVSERFNFWSRQFKEIEGNFGIATTTYFRFTRWLVKINFMVLFLFLCFIYIPQLIHGPALDDTHTTNVSGEQYYDNMVRCSLSYADFVRNTTSFDHGWQTFLEVAQGTGVLENTMLFYGYYFNMTIQVPGGDMLETKYNMGLAYLLTVGASFLIVFVIIVKNSSKTIKETVMDLDSQVFPVHTNAVFSSWDFCVSGEKNAFLKHKIIHNEFKASLQEAETKRQIQNRTKKEKVRLYMKRFLINLVVLALLGGSFYAIYKATEFLLEKETKDLNSIELLLKSYLPSIVISVLNLIVPEMFLVLSTLEEYTHSFATHMTIFRAVFLRLASVWVLIISLCYRLLNEKSDKPFSCQEENVLNETSHHCCGNTLWNSQQEPIKCWESYVGKQFYKLGILDLISVMLVVVVLKIPRSIIHHYFVEKSVVIKKIGKAKFDLPLEVLDIVYSQTVCWMGMFFTPLLPAITFIKVFFFFFLKKFELLKVTDSPQTVYRASRSYSFFQAVLLVSFIVICCLLGYMIGNLQPSMSCGPFRLYSSNDFVMFDVISNEISSWSEEPKKILRYFGTVAFFLPAFLILLLAIYYYWAISVGYKKMEELLKHELKSDAHDKQYLLARVDEVIKRGQLNTDTFTS